ncbi:MAG TPA: hypothetical protein VEC14_02195 [Reyranellaceae bacterium]|nr:hypothetical protein [Reyranellaceae bacterium]
MTAEFSFAPIARAVALEAWTTLRETACAAGAVEGLRNGLREGAELLQAELIATPDPAHRRIVANMLADFTVAIRLLGNLRSVGRQVDLPAAAGVH